jgi:predicted nucleotidyltransferase
MLLRGQGPIMTEAESVQARLRELLIETYGDRLERIVLFGSRARGEERPDSDYDVAVFLHDLTDRAAEVEKLGLLQTLIIDELDAFVHIIPFPAGAWGDRTPLMCEIRREGQAL